MLDNGYLNISTFFNEGTYKKLGYFKLIKGYRYFAHDKSFKENDVATIKELYYIDKELKILIYSVVLEIETYYKNLLLFCLSKTKCKPYMNPIVNTFYTKEKQKDKLKAQRNFISSNVNNYSKYNLIDYYLDKDRDIPVWAVFELMSMGELSVFIAKLDILIREDLSKEIGFCYNGKNYSFDTGSHLCYQILERLRPLRNSVAHNNVIYDVRFSKDKDWVKSANYLEEHTGINYRNFDFKNIFDYLILLSILVNGLAEDKDLSKYFMYNVCIVVEYIINNCILKNTHKDLLLGKNYLNKYNYIKSI